MEDYKTEFVDFLLNKTALKIGEFKLKSNRISPYFVNTGLFDDGESIAELGYFYAAKIIDRFKPEEFDIVFGPAYKGIPLAVATTIALSSHYGINKGYLFNRKEPKSHGEGTKSRDEYYSQKNWLIGHKLEEGNKILMLDDVFTTGDTKYESINLLNTVADDLHYSGLVIAVDRQEVGADGISAIKQFEDKTKILVDSVVNINEIIKHLRDTKKITSQDEQRFTDYLKKYGIEEVKREL